MKLLLTSSGITNEALKVVLQELCPKPLTELFAAFIPTAADGVDEDKSWLIQNLVETQNCGFKGIDIIDIAAVDSLNWKPRLEKADVIFVGGGNTFFLMWWMSKSGLQKELPALLHNKVYVGISAGSMVLGPLVDIPQNDLLYPGESNEMNIKNGLGLVDFCILPHLNSDYFTNLREEQVSSVVKELSLPTYAVDDQTAVQVAGNTVSVVGTGTHLFYP